VKSGKIRYVWSGYDGGIVNGSQEHPYKSIADALDFAQQGDTVAVGADDDGTSYAEAAKLDFFLSYTAIRGRCSSLVTVSGKLSTGFSGGIMATFYPVGAKGVVISGLRITGPGSGIVVSGGKEHHIHDVDVSGNSGSGIVVVDAQDVTIERCRVADNTKGSGSNFGVGIHVEDSTQVQVVDTLLHGNTGLGLEVPQGAQVAVDSCLVTETRSRAEGNLGRGIALGGESVVSVTSSAVKDNAETGISVEGGTQLELTSTLVEGTHVNDDGEFGFGLVATGQTVLQIYDCALVGNTAASLLAVGSEQVELDQVFIADTQPGSVGNGYEAGFGLLVKDVPSALCNSCTLLRNRQIGAFSIASNLKLTSSVVRQTLGDSAGIGRGMELGWHSDVELDSSLVAQSRDIGVYLNDSTLLATRSAVLDTTPDAHGVAGVAMLVYGSATAALDSCLISRAHSQGIFLSDESHLDLAHTLIDKIEPDGSGWVGHGLLVQKVSSVVADRVAVTETHGAGMGFFGSYAEVRDSLVRNVSGSKGAWIVDEKSVELDEPLADGIASVLSYGGDMVLERNSVEDCERVALMFDGSKGSLSHNLVAGSKFGYVVQSSEVEEGPMYYMKNLYDTNPDPREPLPVSNQTMDIPAPTEEPDVDY